MCRRHMPEMTRTFCDDEDIRQTLLDHAGKYSKDLSNVLQSPAHRADLFRYVYLYEHGGLYLDIKCSLRMQFDELRSCLAEEWGTAQSYAHSALGHCPSPPGQLPKDYMVMAIGNRGDHIFHGIIYCRPRHPLVVEAIVQFYSPPIFEGAAASDYLIFCKYLYRVLREKLGHPPQHGWNISSRFGPIYLLRERHSKDLQAHSEIPTDGHYMVTRLNKIAMFTRCWNWKRGFAGDLAAKARNEAQILRAMPEAASDAAWARSQATSPTSPLPGRCMHLTSVLETPNAAEVVFKPPPPLAHGNSTASLPGLPSSPPKLSLGGDAWDPRPPLCLMPGLVAWLEGFGGQALCWAQLAAIWWPEADGGGRPGRCAESYELQEWLRVLCRMHVLTQQMLLGGLEYDELIPLWTEKGVTWHVVETAKLVAGDNGFVAVATGKDETYTIVQDHSRFMLIATSINAVYDYTARKMELPARLVVAQDGKHVHVKHNCGDSPTYLQQHPELAQAATKRQ
ncbi:unnamed protein product, partial [Symbiodinium pilosum]